MIYYSMRSISASAFLCIQLPMIGTRRGWQCRLALARLFLTSYLPQCQQEVLFDILWQEESCLLFFCFFQLWYFSQQLSLAISLLARTTFLSRRAFCRSTLALSCSSTVEWLLTIHQKATHLAMP